MDKVYVVRSKCHFWDYENVEIDEVIAVCSTPEKAHELIRTAYNKVVAEEKENGYVIKEELDTENGWFLSVHMEKEASDLDNQYVQYIFDSIEMELDKLEMGDL